MIIQRASPFVNENSHARKGCKALYFLCFPVFKGIRSFISGCLCFALYFSIIVLYFRFIRTAIQPVLCLPPKSGKRCYGSR